MNFNFDLNLVQSQKLLLTPQLKQALEILRMNSQELMEYIEDEMETNPVLEFADQDDSLDEINYPVEAEQHDWEYESASSISLREDRFDLESLAADKYTLKLSLKEHLLFQLHTSDLNEKETMMGEYMIDNLDDDGYLTISLSQIAKFFNIPSDKVANVLKNVQKFDPPGVFARDLKECLMIQVKSMDHAHEDILKVIQLYLDDLASNKLAYVAKKMGLSVEKVAEIFDFIKSLEPRPGREFYNGDDVKYIVPDIMIRNIRNKFEVVINEDAIPLLNINLYYKEIVHKDINIEARKFIQTKMDSAAWLIRCLEQRKVTLRKVAECILNKQLAFFESGVRAIKPLTMKAVANEVDMHESTVSRTVNGKYIECQWGIFEMRYFFTGKLNNQQGDEISVENIKLMLKNLIKSEDKRNPLSDHELTELMKKEGVQISRRTVAKYRIEMGILNTNKRKRY
ncbi:MAG: RNA polymerase factor sigma-54 [Clostridia bacterium]|nr:RNA polymerase factor sigma-54 [Clostridia bacterium]